MVGFLFILLLAVPIVEIALFIKIGGLIGLWPTIGIVIATALAGAALLRSQGLATLRSARASLAENRFPLDQVFDGLCLAVAGALLLTPGFFTGRTRRNRWKPRCRSWPRWFFIKNWERLGTGFLV